MSAPNTPAAEAAVDDAMAWLAPGAPTTPREAMQRIQWLCEQQPALFEAMWLVSATHPAVPREVLAVAIRRFRPDAAALAVPDVVSLLGAMRNGAWQAFDAVLRARKGENRKSSLSWVKSDD